MLGDAMGKMGLNMDQLSEMEADFKAAIAEGAEDADAENIDDEAENEDGDAPAKGEHVVPTFDFRKIFEDVGLVRSENGETPEKGDQPKPVETSAHDAAKDKAKDKKEKNFDKKYKMLTAHCHNLTRSAAQGKLDNVIGRERELARVVQILCRRQKNNPCLIGEPGVGKTAIAEALAIRIAKGEVPFKLKNKQIYLLDLTSLVAGTQFRGQFEARIQGLINEIKDAGNIILVIDEVHNLVGTGNSEGSMNAANILKPALSRGEIQVIGATTLTEYRKFIEKDAALERRFQPVMVEEPSIDDSIEMLRGIKHYYEAFHGILIPEEILRKTVTLSERYITDRYLPDKAIDLLDEAASYLSLNTAIINESYEIREQLLAVKAERESLEGETTVTDDAASAQRYERIAQLRAKELKLSDRLHAIEPDCAAVALTVEDLAQVIEVWTGIPASTVSENELVKLQKLEEQIKSRIVGQDEAVHAVVRAIKRNRAGISYKRKPVSFIFAGPTGVGKTELVKTLADQLFHSPETLIRLDMSEFMEKHSVSRIIGAPPGYVGYDEAGQLTEKIRRRPYSVVLFDEIEKAHPDVYHLLLQILEDGTLTDSQGRRVDFKNCVLILTSNVGSSVLDKSHPLGFASKSENDANRAAQEEKARNDQLKQTFRPEFLNRLDAILTFAPLGREQLIAIAHRQLELCRQRLENMQITLQYDDSVVERLVESANHPAFGARPLRREVTSKIENMLANMMLSGSLKAFDHVHIITTRNGYDCNIHPRRQNDNAFLLTEGMNKEKEPK
jgi:ATP-dependent Clp protease ATP-binding subunit ClpA